MEKCGRKEVHGHRGNSKKSPEYNAWDKMKQRCYNQNCKIYSRYGGRGIKVCGRWLESFENFLADMGERPSPKHSLDRYPDFNGNYEPGNVRWATPKEQQRNRTDNHYITFGGKTLTLSEWGEVTGINCSTIQSRIETGWAVEKALTTPLTITYLTDEDAERIRSLNNTGIPQIEIAKEYNVSPASVNKIIKNKTHVNEKG